MDPLTVPGSIHIPAFFHNKYFIEDSMRAKFEKPAYSLRTELK